MAGGQGGSTQQKPHKVLGMGGDSGPSLSTFLLPACMGDLDPAPSELGNPGLAGAHGGRSSSCPENVGGGSRSP